MLRTLRDDINELVVRRMSNALLTGQKVNAPNYVDELVQSLADIILQQDKGERAQLVAHAKTKLEEYVSEGYG